jgi:hypothetical protein
MDVRQQWNLALIELARYATRILDSIDLPDKPVIVFDVDSTLMDHENQVIKPIRTIYHYARMLGITVVIITSRVGNAEVINITRQQLKAAGVDEVGFWYFRKSTTYNHWSFKHNARLNIHERGFTVVMSLGDAPWDIGEYGGIGMLVPIMSSFCVAYALPWQTVEDHFLPKTEVIS